MWTECTNNVIMLTLCTNSVLLLLDFPFFEELAVVRIVWWGLDIFGGCWRKSLSGEQGNDHSIEQVFDDVHQIGTDVPYYIEHRHHTKNTPTIDTGGVFWVGIGVTFVITRSQALCVCRVVGPHCWCWTIFRLTPDRVCSIYVATRVIVVEPPFIQPSQVKCTSRVQTTHNCA